MCKSMKTPYFIYNDQLRMNDKKAAVEEWVFLLRQLSFLLLIRFCKADQYLYPSLCSVCIALRWICSFT